MKSIKEVLGLAKGFLEKHRILRARLVSEMLLSHFLKCERIELYTHFDRPLLEEELESFRGALKRVIKGEPFEYVMGEVDFFDCKLKVTPDVLIPRQETEILLDLICKEELGKKALDLCTGSGCLAIGLKKKHPEIEVVGVDLSEKALDVARENGSKNDVEIKWLKGDLTHPVKDQKFDLVMCNPPYIATSEYDALDPSVKNFEPKMALTPGKTGYEIFDRLSSELPGILNPGAKVFFEIGYNQANGVLERFSTKDWTDIELRKDLAGKDRFFYLKRNEFSSIV